MKLLVNPVVNLNGNSADDLLEKTMDIVRHIGALKNAMNRASDLTHGRNFQHLIKGEDWTEHHVEVRQAQQAFADRYVLLDNMEHEFTNMALDIQRQQRERKRA